MEVRATHPASGAAEASRQRVSKVGACHECGAPTREGKPWCDAHLARSPYVAALLVREERRAVELAGKPSAIELDGPCAEDLLTALRVHGEATAARLARDAVLPLAVVQALVRKLRAVGVVHVGMTARGGASVELLEDWPSVGAGSLRAPTGDVR